MQCLLFVPLTGSSGLPQVGQSLSSVNVFDGVNRCCNDINLRESDLSGVDMATSEDRTSFVRPCTGVISTALRTDAQLRPTWPCSHIIVRPEAVAARWAAKSHVNIPGEEDPITKPLPVAIYLFDSAATRPSVQLEYTEPTGGKYTATKAQGRILGLDTTNNMRPASLVVEYQ